MHNSVLMLYNPTARKGKIAKYIPYIETRLKTKYKIVDFIASKSAEDLKEQAKINAGLYDLIIVAGGDGSLHLAINGIKESGVDQKLAFMPYGTVNDVCRTLRMPRKVEKAIDIILRGETIKYDTMKDKDKYYIYTLAGGMFVSTSFKTNRKLKNMFGKLAYYFTGIKEVIKMRSLPLTIVADGERFHGRYIFCMLLNSASVAGYRVNKDKGIDDEMIDLVLIEKRKSFIHSLLVLAKMFLFGMKSLTKSKIAIVRKCKNIHLENHSNECFTKDGEAEQFLKKDIAISSPLTVIYNKR